MAGNLNRKNIMGGLPTPVANRRSAVAQTAQVLKRNANINRQAFNSSMLTEARSRYKKAATTGQQNVIAKRIKVLEKRPVR